MRSNMQEMNSQSTLKKLKDRDRKMKEIKYIGVEFEPTDVKKGEEEVNTALKAGFEPIRDFQTPKGIVMVLGLWGDRKRTN